MLVLDTNVYIDMVEDAERAEHMARALEDVEDPMRVSSVVLSELLIGLKDPGERPELIRRVLPDEDLIITPTHDDWLVAGDALRQLGGNAATKRRSFWNDALIAAGCVRLDATLVTSNNDDFRRLRKLISVRTAPAWW